MNGLKDVSNAIVASGTRTSNAIQIEGNANVLRIVSYKPEALLIVSIARFDFHRNRRFQSPE